MYPVGHYDPFENVFTVFAQKLVIDSLPEEYQLLHALSLESPNISAEDARKSIAEHLVVDWRHAWNEKNSKKARTIDDVEQTIFRPSTPPAQFEPYRPFPIFWDRHKPLFNESVVAYTRYIRERNRYTVNQMVHLFESVALEVPEEFTFFIGENRTRRGKEV